MASHCLLWFSPAVIYWYNKMKIISQSTFDSVVLENIVEFEKSLEEAIDETSAEFEAQVWNMKY